MTKPRTVRAVAVNAPQPRSRGVQPIPLVLVAALVVASPVLPQENPDLVEKVERELIQLEVRIEGPPDLLDSLSAEDLNLRIDGRSIARFSLDRTCAETGAPGQAPIERAAGPGAAAVHHTSYLLYFDQHQLRVDGRARALELARSLVPEVLRNGGRARIVSAGLRVESFSDWTDDEEALLDALDRLERDPAQIDSWASREDLRVAEVLQILDARLDLAAGVSSPAVNQQRTLESYAGLFQGPPRNSSEQTRQTHFDRALESTRDFARIYQRDERLGTEQALERFTLALSSLGGVARPRAVLYFADTVRANPGDHYVRLFINDHSLAGTEGTIPAFDEVIRAAVANDARLYTVQAAGLVSESSLTTFGRSGLQYASGPLNTSARFVDAKSALAGFAAETGGQTFLHGAGADRIAQSLRRDLDCLYLISFGPRDLPRDRKLSVRVTARMPGLRVATRPSVVIRGEATRRRERLAQAFLLADSTAAEPGFAVSVIPLDAGTRGYTGLLQIALPTVPDGGVTWDVGATLLGTSGGSREIAGRASVDRPGVPVVYEAQVDFAPGPYELVAVAQDERRARVLSLRVTGNWPDLGSAGVGFGPLIALQPDRAAFVRGDVVRDHGSLGLDEPGAVDPARPLAIVGVACGAGTFTIERRLIGETTTEFLPIEPDPGERCAVFRDLVPAGTLGTGHFVYESEVRSADGEVVARSERQLVVDDRTP